MSYIVGFLQEKYPHANLNNILRLSAKKEIRPEALADALNKSQNNPIKLSQNLASLGFNKDDLASSLSTEQRSFANKKSNE